MNDPQAPVPSENPPPDPAPNQPGRRPSGRRRTAIGGLTVLGAGAIAALVVGGGVLPGLGGSGSPAGPVDLGPVGSVALSTFSNCPALLDYYRRGALPEVGPYGLAGPIRLDVATSVAAGAERSTASATAAPVAPTSETGTTVQVAGVDEADLAKKVGDLVLTVASDGGSQGLRVLRAGGGTATVLARFDTPGWYPESLLVDGTTVVLIGAAPAPDGVVGGPEPAAVSGDRVMMLPVPWVPRTRLAQVDLADPARPRLVRTLDVDGSLNGARLVDGVLRVAVTSGPRDLAFVSPKYPDQPVPMSDSAGATASTIAPTPPSQEEYRAADEAATAANRAVVQRSTIENWLPSYTLTPAGGQPSKGTLGDCADVSAPARYAGYQTLTLAGFDLRGSGLATWQSSAVVASGAVLYATRTTTYVATASWQGARTTLVAPTGAETTQIHAFDTTDARTPRYVASGEVPGYLLNQFSMDEHDGALRVATTTQPPADRPIPIEPGPGGPAVQAPAVTSTDASAVIGAPAPSTPATSSRVSVLRRSGDRLAVVGQVTGLGAGERIVAVRFLGDVGYVVTFRRTDPLYTLDLRDPTAPKVSGELKIPGYSAYLHPAGPGLLLGVGQDAGTDGQVTGAQLSLFDVSDPAAPQRIAQVKLPRETWTDAENDHHAFTLADGLVLLPYSRSWTAPGPAPLPAPTATVGNTGEAGSPGSTDSPGSPGSAGEPAQPGVVGVPYWQSGVVAIRLTGRSLSAPTLLAGRSTGPIRMDTGTYQADQALRTFVGDGTVWTVSTTGLAAHDAQSLTRLGFTPYVS